MQKVTTGIYCRVSTEEQASEGFSINAQKDKLTKYAEINDWEIIDYYIDDGISGKNLQDRPEATRLIKDVEDGKITNILVYKLDRLTRSVKDLINLIELFDKYNCTFNSQTEKIDTSNAVGRMFVKIIGIFAEFERENLAERVSFGYEQKTKEGNYTNCNGVFGYDYLKGAGTLNVNNTEAYYVSKIYDWYLEGKSMLEIAKKMKSLNIPTKRGGEWNQSTINSILKNPLYIGKIRYGVNKKNGFETTGKNIIPLIDDDTFYNVQQLIEKRKNFNIKKYSSDDTYYFSVLKCGYCGSKYHAKQQIQNGKKYITYKCNGNNHHKCTSVGFSHNKIEEEFLKYLDNIKDFKFNEKILKENLNNTNNKIIKINQEIEKLKKKKEETTILFSKNEIDHNILKQTKEIVDSKLLILTKELKTIKNNIDESINIDREIVKEIITNLKNNFINFTNHEKKIFIERFIKEIKVKKEGNKVIIENIKF